MPLPLPIPGIALRNPRTAGAAAAAAATAYLVLVRVLRYRRRDRWQREFADKYGACDRAALANMTVEDAQHILRGMTELEFPSIFSASVFFALFKTYGIPTISQLLQSTGQLASDRTSSKRATDTGVLVSEFVLNEPSSGRRAAAVARMNWLHERWRRSGRITDADMLYTLSLFALEPARWAARHDWRPLADLERAALGTFWRDMGEAMGIPCEAALAPHYYKGTGTGTTADDGGEAVERELRLDDGLAWLRALDRWSVAYEEDHMVPADSNEAVAAGTLHVVTYNTPVPLRPLMVRLVGVLLEPRLRAAMRLPEPSRAHTLLVHALLRVRALAVRHLHLPRPALLRRRFFTDDPDPETGRYHATQYVAHPWYVRPGFRARWGSLEALRTRLLWRGLLPGDGGAAYHPEGYDIAEVGPEALRGKGGPEMERIKEELRAREESRRAGGRGGGGCPMATVMPLM